VVKIELLRHLELRSCSKDRDFAFEAAPFHVSTAPLSSTSSLDQILLNSSNDRKCLPNLEEIVRTMDSKYKQHKNPFFGHLTLSTSGPLDCALTGVAILRNPYFNKGSAFTAEERDTFELHGLLPCNVQSLDEQVRRAYHQYSTRENDLAKNTFMSSLRLQNEVLFYKVRRLGTHRVTSLR
jgi:hypothetical protein